MLVCDEIKDEEVVTANNLIMPCYENNTTPRPVGSSITNTNKIVFYLLFTKSLSLIIMLDPTVRCRDLRFLNEKFEKFETYDKNLKFYDQ
jgi:hypothetical protein